jgi:hypothetical protein
MNEDDALCGGSIVIGAALVFSQLADNGPLTTGATLGMLMVVFGIRGLRGRRRGSTLPIARVRRP